MDNHDIVFPNIQDTPHTIHDCVLRLIKFLCRIPSIIDVMDTRILNQNHNSG